MTEDEAGAAPKLRPWLQEVAPYVPGERAPASAGSLASNEAPLAPPPSVARALARVAGEAHRYPDPLAGGLRRRLAARLAVSPDQILVGNGSDELIQLLVLAYAAWGGSVAVASPAYRMHELVATQLGAAVRAVPLAGWHHDLEAMAEVQADLAFVCNPHNPTGTAVGVDRVARFVERARAGLVVVDEAYVDFADRPEKVTSLPLAAAGRVVVLRTFSKVYGLAGLRIGYLVGPEPVVAELRGIRLPFSVNSAAQEAALSVLEDEGHREKVRCYTARARAQLRAAFREAGYASVPSEANFVLVMAPREEALVEHLSSYGVSVRPGSSLGVPNTIRVSVPSPEGMDLVRRAVAELRPPS